MLNEESRIHVSYNVHRSVAKIFRDMCDKEGWIMSRAVEKAMLDYVTKHDKGESK